MERSGYLPAAQSRARDSGGRSRSGRSPRQVQPGMESMTSEAHDSDTHDDPHREAREWLGRIQATEISDATRAEFEQWLQASPDHRSAFERAHAVWSLIGQSDRIETWANDL